MCPGRYGTVVLQYITVITLIFLIKTPFVVIIIIVVVIVVTAQLSNNNIIIASSISTHAILYAATRATPFMFSPSFGNLVENIVSRLGNLAIRRRGIKIMRKWPYKESGTRSEDAIVFIEAAIEHEITGPARTRASQLAGNPVLPMYENGEVEGREFDGTKACECIIGLFVCLEHKWSQFRVDSTSERPCHEFISKYELRNGSRTLDTTFSVRQCCFAGNVLNRRRAQLMRFKARVKNQPIRQQNPL